MQQTCCQRCGICFSELCKQYNIARKNFTVLPSFVCINCLSAHLCWYKSLGALGRGWLAFSCYLLVTGNAEILWWCRTHNIAQGSLKVSKKFFLGETFAEMYSFFSGLVAWSVSCSMSLVQSQAFSLLLRSLNGLFHSQEFIYLLNLYLDTCFEPCRKSYCL